MNPIAYELSKLPNQLNQLSQTKQPANRQTGSMKHITPQNIKSLVGLFADRIGLSPRLRKGKSIILMYHRVIDEHASQVPMQPGMYVTKSTFEMHIKYLKEHFELVSLNNILTNQHNRCNRCNYQPPCSITFDDGWFDSYTNAFPILREYNVPATIFLPVDFIGTSNWFWSEKIYHLLQEYTESGKNFNFENNPFLQKILDITGGNHKRHADLASLGDMVINRMKSFSHSFIESFINEWAESLKVEFPPKRLFLNWEEIKEMSRHGIAFGSHTVSHRILTKLSSEEREAELSKSFEILKEAGINFTPICSYPNGDCDKEILDIVRDCGYTGAVTTQYGTNNSHTDPFLLKRIGIHEDISRTKNLFSFHLTNACI